jgi:hypothetical protein
VQSHGKAEKVNRSMTIEVFDPASAKAIEEVAKTGSKVIDAGTGLAAYLDRVSSKLPENLVGLLGDYVEHKRLRRLADLWGETREHLRKRAVTEKVDVSPSVLLPLLGAAMDEDRAVLKELWAKLLAAAMDPKRAEFVRPSLIALLKQMDPLDAKVLERLIAGDYPGLLAAGNAAEQLAKELGVTRDDAYFSLDHLLDLGALLSSPSAQPVPTLTAKARLLMRAVS